MIATDLWLDDPQLWWPNGQGDQPLYALEARLLDAADGALLAERATRFAIREIRWQQVDGAPADFINPYQLVVNGRPLRMLGSNILPPDLLFGRMNERGCRLIRQAAGAGMNSLRVWGGGVFPTDDMFNLADELGIMLSQEFPMSSCRPETDAVFLANLEATVRGLVKRYRNHPCIIEWSGGNEMWWYQGDDHPALHLLERIVAEEDSRLFRATCPIQGARHSPWHYDPETHYAHYDDEELRDTGWRRGENKMMRYGEFGCHSPAHLEVWQREIPPALHWPAYDENNATLIRKNVVQAVFTKEHWLLKSIFASLFGPVSRLEDVVEAGQYLGAHGLRYAVDALRRRGRSIGGILTWVLNEPWPNGGGPYLVDYDGRPLIIFEFQKQALAPISLSLKYESSRYDARRRPDRRSFGWSATRRSRRRICAGVGLCATLRDANCHNLRIALQLSRCKPSSWETSIPARWMPQRPHPCWSSCSSPTRAAACSASASNSSARPLSPLHWLRSCPAPGGSARPPWKRSLSPIIGTAPPTCCILTWQIMGAMTALFCQAQPLLAYRTDLDIDNNYAFIPPGERRRLSASAPPLTRAQASVWRRPDGASPAGTPRISSSPQARTSSFQLAGAMPCAASSPVMTIQRRSTAWERRQSTALDQIRPPSPFSWTPLGRPASSSMSPVPGSGPPVCACTLPISRRSTRLNWT